MRCIAPTGPGYLPYLEAANFSSAGQIGQAGPTGQLGQATTADNNSPPRSNHAIWDQIAVLHWLKRNLAAFNGNPAAVSLLAADRQAAQTVQLLALSPQAKGKHAPRVAHRVAEAG